MKLRPSAFAALAVLSTTLITAVPAFAQEKASTPAEAKPSSSNQPSDEDMAKMMALAQPGENHKALALLTGSWKYQVKYWIAPDAPPALSNGTSTCKPIMGGRYFQSEATGVFHMPGPDGQMHDLDFNAQWIDAYDNMKQKYIATWIDNMGTGVTILEGSYDPASKTFTYTTEEEMMPGVKTKVRETIKIVDHDHHVLEWYEHHGNEDVKTMEISYTRQS